MGWWIIIIITVMLMDCSFGQYPNCVDSCPDGSIPLMPLSYNTIRSHVFSGTLSSIEGCTNGPSVDEQVTIDCGLGTALVDCDSGFNGGDFSGLSNLSIFTWNKTASLSQRVPIIVTFDQQINIDRIHMYFWNSTSDNIRVPDVAAYWSSSPGTPSNIITASYSTDCSSNGGCVLIITGTKRLRYLRIVMTFHFNHDWIFLSEMQFCGDIAPYHITQPPTDYYEQIISPTATMASITCALNITITSNFIILWDHNGTSTIGTTRGKATTYMITDLQPSDVGVYECIFIDDNGWRLSRTITLVIKTECNHLSEPANGRVELCSSGRAGVGFEGGTCSYTCNTGYVLIGSDTRTCQSNGSWSGSDVACRQVLCPSLTNSSNGVMSCSLGDDGVPSYEDTCSFTCNTGYELNGSDTRICQSDGGWSGSDAVCRIVSCPPLTNPDNGIINCSMEDDQGPSYEDTCNFRCNTGYELTGSDTRTCQSDGTWSGSDTVCGIVSCPTLTNLNNGVISCSPGGRNPSYGDTCNFICNTGYKLNGSDTRTCQSDGGWSGSDAVCLRVSCPSLSNHSNGIIINCSLGDDRVPSYEDTCSFSCDNGNELIVIGNRTCQSNGSWSGSENFGRCKISCSELNDPNNGVINCSLGDDGVPSQEDTCSFTCNTGYELTGSDTRTCQSNGSWSGSDAACERVSCPPLTNPGNGIINCSLGDDQVPSYEDTCNFTCNTGYELTGSDTRTCQSDGSWSGSDDICRRVSCSSLPNPNNGIITCSLGDDGAPSYGDTCNFTCNTGYELTGSDTRTCQSDGSWSGNDVVCSKVFCTPLIKPTDGSMNCSLGDDGIPSYEDTCSFTCNTGYELTGRDTRTCRSDGRWSGIDDVCRRVQCRPPINGILKCPNGANTAVFGDTCTFSCKQGFNLQGQSTGTCLANGRWSGGNPICLVSGEIACVNYKPTGVCENFQSIFDYPVKIAVNLTHAENISTSQRTAFTFYRLLTSQVIVHKQCLKVLLPFVCRWVFPTCDPAFNVSVEQYICRRGCEILTNFVCNEVWLTVLSQVNILDFLGVNIPICDFLERSNGGEAPDCIDTLDGGKIPDFSITSDCFNGRGRGYSGNINMTRSGKTCQHWNVQAPHKFILPFQQYPELGDHNYCRNPGSRGPKGPWCFTTDPNTRWEYCNVPKCAPSPSCELYHNDTSNAICFKYGSIGMDYVYVDNGVDNMDELNAKLIEFNGTLNDNIKSGGYPEECVDIILGLMCHHSFPLCDRSSDTPVPRKICRSYCEEVSMGKCRALWNEFNQFSSLAIVKLPNCTTLPSPEGGDYLECFIPYNNGRERRDTNSTNCYTEDDLGIRYNGTINVTVSGIPCQYWDSATPHSHPITSLHRYYLEGHNRCRNPEGRGSRPWCYTMDPSVRWEYCDVPHCSSLLTSTDASASESTPIIIVVAVVVPVLIILIVTLIIIICAMRRCIQKKESQQYPFKLHLDKEEQKDEACINEYYNPKMLTDENLPYFARENVTYIGDLGQGNFGMVMKGEAMGIIPGEHSTLVAIKVLKEESGKDAKNDFVKEAVHMSQFNHPNILKLLGVCFDKEPLCLIFEYMDLGDLNNYLRKTAISSSRSSSSLTSKQLVDMAINIAAGLEYLAVRRFVHRDLATRNCLVNEMLFVKISDFGLSKDVYSRDYYKLGDKSVLPIRWMPPEAILFSTFTTQSDIWSLGIVLWEIFSSGTQPYCALTNEEVVERVTKGHVLRCPSGCPKELYHLMVRCWASEPTERPTASEVYTHLLKWSPSEDGDTQPAEYIVMKPSVSSSPGIVSPSPLEETAV